MGQQLLDRLVLAIGHLPFAPLVRPGHRHTKYAARQQRQKSVRLARLINSAQISALRAVRALLCSLRPDPHRHNKTTLNANVSHF